MNYLAAELTGDEKQQYIFRPERRRTFQASQGSSIAGFNL